MLNRYFSYQLTEALEMKYIRRVLSRSFYHFVYSAGERILYTTADEEAFQRICERAYCEKMSEGNKAMLVTKREYDDFYYLSCLMQITGRSAVAISREENIPQLFVALDKKLDGMNNRNNYRKINMYTLHKKTGVL